jgi:hypothetical protein
MPLLRVDWAKTQATNYKCAEEIQLPAKSVLRMDANHGGISILCRSGLCWITQEGDSKDYLLKHQQNFTICQTGVVVIEALADTELLVKPEQNIDSSSRNPG